MYKSVHTDMVEYDTLVAIKCLYYSILGTIYYTDKAISENWNLQDKIKRARHYYNEYTKNLGIIEEKTIVAFKNKSLEMCKNISELGDFKAILDESFKLHMGGYRNNWTQLKPEFTKFYIIYRDTINLEEQVSNLEASIRKGERADGLLIQTNKNEEYNLLERCLQYILE